eukprot:3038297-Pyramimonas_sp.AAC.1
MRACLEWVSAGSSFFDAASTAIQAFPPKKIDDDELQSGSCSRSPNEVRVLGLRNCDVNVLSATMT